MRSWLRLPYGSRGFSDGHELSWGVGAALLTRGSVAMIQASFAEQDRGKAIGAWWNSGDATAIGPFIGGSLVEGTGWSTSTLLSLALGMVALGAFGVNERRSPNPRVPPAMFRNHQFTAANVVTFLVYAALGAVFFLLVVDLQVVAGFSPFLAGSALPLMRSGTSASYVLDGLPGVTVLGLGLALIVAPLTTTVLAAVEAEHAGHQQALLSGLPDSWLSQRCH